MRARKSTSSTERKDEECAANKTNVECAVLAFGTVVFGYQTIPHIRRLAYHTHEPINIR